MTRIKEYDSAVQPNIPPPANQHERTTATMTQGTRYPPEPEPAYPASWCVLPLNLRGAEGLPLPWSVAEEARDKGYLILAALEPRADASGLMELGIWPLAYDGARAAPAAACSDLDAPYVPLLVPKDESAPLLFYRGMQSSSNPGSG